MFYCAKKEKRTLFDLFKIYTCDNCKYLLEDENIKIGYNNIRIYYLENVCRLEEEKFYYKNTKRIKLIFKDIMISKLLSDKNIVLWLDRDDDLSSYYIEFDYYLNKDYKIIIIK